MQNKDESSGNIFIDIARFNLKYGFDTINPNLIDKAFLQFRLMFVVEELKETIRAFDHNNAEELIDGHIDMIQVLVGNFVFMGVDLEKAWEAVFTPNMSKEVGVNSTRQGSGGIDLFKPQGWVAPDHSNNHGRLPEILVGESDLYNEVFHSHPILHMVNQHCANVGDNSNSVVLKFIDFLEYSGAKLPISQTDRDKLAGGAVRVFEECAALQRRKSADYSSAASDIQRADYFPFGLENILFMVRQKCLRVVSIMEKLRAGAELNFESLEDSIVDDIVYSAFAIEWLRGEMPGQDLRLRKAVMGK
jgi:hypothetical protein